MKEFILGIIGFVAFVFVMGFIFSLCCNGAQEVDPNDENY